MAIPTSGILYICNLDGIYECRSLAHAVYVTNLPSDVSLSAMGSFAGFSTPVAMSDFYGYSATNTINVSVSLNVAGSAITLGGTLRLETSTGILVDSVNLFGPSFIHLFTPEDGIFYRLNMSQVAAFDSNFNLISRSINWIVDGGISRPTTGVGDITSNFITNVTVSMTVTG